MSDGATPVRPDASDPAATAVLTIDLNALQANYRDLKARPGSAECAAVVKADAYGLGVAPAARALARAGCGTFFVATPGEAETLRRDLPETTVYVLDGLFPGAGETLAVTGARPVLSSLAEIEEWASVCAQRGEKLPAAIHIDTGMNRLGLYPDESAALTENPDLLETFDLALVMSHLACADEPDHPMNEAQRAAFETARMALPPAPASLANSGGILLGPAYHYDLVRPGVALYGGLAAIGENPMRPVVRLDARIAQVREAKTGDAVGYGAAQTLKRPTRIAVIAAGYADGIFRHLGASDSAPGLTGYIGDHPAPVLGRISMDLITLDVTDVPEDLAVRGAFVELLGPHVSVDDLADQAGTIGYEVLTSLGRRYRRVYTGE